MSKSSYEVHNEYLKEADFSVIVLEIPETEIEDKLAFLAKDKGQITKSYYEDYIMSVCVANVNQLIVHLQKQIDPPSIMAIRGELMSVLFRHNPLFSPDKLLINRNHVVKIRTDESETLKEGEKLLEANPYWGTSSYEAIVAEYEEGMEEDSSTNDEIDPGESEVVQRWWKRIGKYINIKKFSTVDLKAALEDKYFHNRTSFNKFVVAMCVQDFESLFNLLENEGIPKRVAPPILIGEIYELCRDCNPHLVFENAQVSTTEEEPSSKGKTGPQMSAKTGKAAKTKDKKPKKVFKDVNKKELLGLNTAMKVSVIGQDEALDNISDAVLRASVGLKAPERPIGSFLFAGRTGCGKSLTSKVLANELIKMKDSIITIDCSEYSSDHEYAKLIGAPAGYVGFENGGILTNAIIKNPFSVVVFDEVEKASTKLHDLMLQILEDGRLTDNKGTTVSFKDTIIIMTSNVGVKEIDAVGRTMGFGTEANLTSGKQNKAIESALKKEFKPEFINRIDSIVYFNTLTKKDYMRIIDIELYKLNDNLKNNDTEYKHISLSFCDKIKEAVYKNGINEKYGARPLKREIERSVSTPLAQKLLSEDVSDVEEVKVSYVRKKIQFELKRKTVDEVEVVQSALNPTVEKE